jgi:hypothetical protein
MIMPPKATIVTPSDNLELIFDCPFCAETSRVTLTPSQHHQRYKEHKSIQDITPLLDITTRETLNSGLCKSCQKDMFG